MWRLPIALLVLAIAAPAASARVVLPRAFGSCNALVAYGEHHLAQTHRGPSPTVQPLPVVTAPPSPGAENGTVAPVTAAPATPDASAVSTTNNQEEGVDEPDLAQTDGRTIFVLARGKLQAVSVPGDAPRVVGTLDVGPGAGAGQLLLRGDRLIVIAPGGEGILSVDGGGGGGPRPLIAIQPFALQTVVTEVDVHAPAAMKVARTMTIDGAYVDARQNGSTARVVISSAPRAIALPADRDARAGWVPARRFRSRLTGRHYVRPVAGCATIRHPVAFSGLGMLTILTIDLDRGLWAADSDALMADAQVVYGSKSSLYVATQKWVDPQTPPGRLPAADATVIHRFDVSDPDRTTFAASGDVDGYLLNQFSLSEDAGHLRAATTTRPIWWHGGQPPQSESMVTVLRQRGAALEQVGRVTGLGKGEQIYSVRFAGDVGYVVTFRRIDPLFTIDLSNPAKPRKAGELELRGYSAYLHPLGNGLLLGVGVDVAPQGNEPQQAQLVLFDVSDPATPKLLQRATLGQWSTSEVQYDHHAFLYWPRTQLAVLPVQAQDFTGAIGYRLDRAGIAERGPIAHDGAPVRRAIVIGDRLYTVSDAGILASGLGDLAARSFAAFAG